MILARPFQSLLYAGEATPFQIELCDQDGNDIEDLEDDTTVVTLTMQRDVEDDDPIVDAVTMTVESATTVGYNLTIDPTWLGYYLGQVTVTKPGVGPGAFDITMRSAPFIVKVARSLSGA